MKRDKKKEIRNLVCICSEIKAYKIIQIVNYIFSSFFHSLSHFLSLSLSLSRFIFLTFLSSYIFSYVLDIGCYRKNRRKKSVQKIKEKKRRNRNRVSSHVRGALYTYYYYYYHYYASIFSLSRRTFCSQSFSNGHASSHDYSHSRFFLSLSRSIHRTLP